MSQSRAIARRIERRNPDVRVELVGIETQGDRRLDVPLSQIEGKEFFVAELDTALLNSEVDLTVHSMKDLSLARPDGIVTGAIPERENPRDVILFAHDIATSLANGNAIRIGTSSPRRIENLAPFLSHALPKLGPTPRLETIEIRGNVNTRINLIARDNGPNKVDAVVLAFAGLQRLWADDAGHTELARLLEGLRWMVLPLREYPTAPAQGALAIECRAADRETRQILEPLHCATTARAVAMERQVLDDWGGGCHQRFGATVTSFDDLGSLLFIRGRKPDGTPVEETRWNGTAADIDPPLWDGSEWRGRLFATRYREDLDTPAWLTEPGAIFIAHSRALPTTWHRALRDNATQRVWTSGTASWYRLASQGIWVEGCAEEFGFDALRPMLRQSLLDLPAFDDWQVLSHTRSADTWPAGKVTATYEIRPLEPIGPDHEAVIMLLQARSVFWASGSQFDLFRQWVPDGCQHACRHGKTFRYLKEQGIENPSAYPDAATWRTLAAC